MVVWSDTILSILFFQNLINSYIFERQREPVQLKEFKVPIPIQFKNWGLLKIVCPESFETFKPFLLKSMLEPVADSEIPKHLNCMVDKNGGFGVDVYILDTGIDYNHIELGGRVRSQKSFVPDEPNYDIHGHGSHVAGIIGSFSYGLAKESRLISIKVLDKGLTGYSTAVIDAFRYVHKQIEVAKRPSLIHMSATVEYNPELNQIVRDTVVKYNTSVIIAAGNGNEDSCRFSPASSKYAFTVSGIGINFKQGDTIPPFSNYGKCIDILAPGKDIMSLYNDNSTTRFRTGSSMAAPFVTGIAATLLAKGHPNGLQLYQTLKDSAYLDVVTSLRVAQVPKNYL